MGVVGALLINVGSPEAPETAPVRRYLRQFLGDPRVLDIAAPLRVALLEGVILRTRPTKSAALYRKVWTPDGSPLLVHSRALASAVAERLGAGWRVEIGMRYGHPDIAGALERLLRAGSDRLVVVPLYPHAASSSFGSAVEEVFRLLAPRNDVPPISVVAPFHSDDGFLQSWREILAAELSAFDADHVLFSFHGLPERHVRASDTRGASCLDAPSCCDVLSSANAGCYRAQCHETARQLAARLGLARESWSIGFQSRLGRTPWIKPHTDVVLPALAKAGKRRVLVACPGFVADCLETLEEIGMREKGAFLQAGGADLRLAPCLNATPRWTDALTELIRSSAG